jgi:hypothetical protein
MSKAEDPHVVTISSGEPQRFSGQTQLRTQGAGVWHQTITV